MTDYLRPAWVDIDLDAIRHNVEVLRSTVAPAEVCAVVKADGYGHGGVEVARAALAGGATRLAVALVEEGQKLRQAGIKAPILILSEPRPEAMSVVIANDLTPTLYSELGVSAFTHAVDQSPQKQYPIHVKVDTGMNRVGVRCDQAVGFMEMIRQAHEQLFLEGVFTHFAVADEPNNDFTLTQGERFVNVLKSATDLGIAPPIVHASNSAAGLLHPEFRFSFVRCGIAIYGLQPGPEVALPAGMKPALRIAAQVVYSKIVDAGAAISYGQRYRVDKPTRIATVPLGYADGLPRSLASDGGMVLIGGRKRPIAGTVTMDQITVDCGEDDIKAGDEVVLIGHQGNQSITAQDWAQQIGTISYEITCRISPRLPRRYHFQ